MAKDKGLYHMNDGPQRANTYMVKSYGDVRKSSGIWSSASRAISRRHL